MSIYTSAKSENKTTQELVAAFKGEVTICPPGKKFQTFRQRGTWEANVAKNGAEGFVTMGQRSSSAMNRSRG